MEMLNSYRITWVETTRYAEKDLEISRSSKGYWVATLWA